MTPWLHIVGLGAAGEESLSSATRAVVADAEVILGGARHHGLCGNTTAERLAWPSPFDAMIDTLLAHRGRRVVVLATGDPLWYSVGARIGREIPVSEITYHPQVSAFQLASARMGWSLADVETLTVHGRPAEQVLRFVEPGARLLLLTAGSETPGQIAALLRDRGYGAARMTVLAHMGGAEEARFDGLAESWDAEVPAFHTLAVECIAGPEAQVLPRIGLPDDAFVHDGNFTKQELRALTLAKLMPMRGQLLWDIGSGCGSVGVEWMRGARDARAIGIEPRADRRALAAENALRLGAPRLHLVEGRAPEALSGLAEPDAVFIGGGVSEATVTQAWAALKPFGRLVANAVTLESEALLARMQADLGGDLVRISVARMAPVGRLRGWKPQMGVTQWSVLKR
ncbi:precorrin-6y C5,15-methyltransferase (decarboxylating) subunit CbiE [Pseudooceanicola sp. CBS1P-1]|uniref:Precorrin-6y C5,15-methyltransferase (Decarboxylating) subunit CbiE n=1 Tax=Pseudooceanicola albus TaxID=2692189 RepID=A0A6L7G4H9_9RHOB|nr:MULTISPECIES: precorrin-6y C5,15-methyltransferase (decarboxylating) subunit CbiE [Pseudooceanicola]MBT9384726.1 precorrin-6y C5,15-methyltransferase (decarboxylating) subunit CbiE [Pseudooceanicola endophyticus]MXN18427.1 precorrin-6y C5,15-methyltransferase (decarboxylating) subunit CbiE [Pseudooceanicola albus]